MSEPVGGYMPPPSGSFHAAPQPASAGNPVEPYEQDVPGPVAPGDPSGQSAPLAYPSAAYGAQGVPQVPPPPYAYAPPPVAHGAYGYGQGNPALYPTAQPQNGSRNVLGILSIIFPFVCLAPVGIILGHLGLSAAKKGLANNRGLALAGTIVSYVVTALSIPFIVLVIFGINEESKHDGYVDSDLRALQSEVLSQWDGDSANLPYVTTTSSGYLVGDEAVDGKADLEDVFVFVDSSGSGVCVEGYWDFSVRSIDADGTLHDTGCDMFFPSDDPVVDETDEATADPTGAAEPTAGGIGDQLMANPAVGECILDPYETAVDQGDGNWIITSIDIVPCDKPHYAEAYASAQTALTEFDGAAVMIEAEELCVREFEGYIGVPYESSSLYYDYWYPTAESWKLGDRELLCMVTTLATDTEGSLKGSGL